MAVKSLHIIRLSFGIPAAALIDTDRVYNISICKGRRDHNILFSKFPLVVMQCTLERKYARYLPTSCLSTQYYVLLLNFQVFFIVSGICVEGNSMIELLWLSNVFENFPHHVKLSIGIF